MTQTAAQDAAIPKVLTGTVGFTRKVQPAQYEGAEASIYLQFDYDPADSIEAIVAKAEGAFAQAKGLVFEQLGIEFSVNEGGRIMETVRKAFGAVENVTPIRPAAAPAAVDHAAAGAGGMTCKQCQGTEFYDNRAKKASGEFKANSPDFKCKGCGKGVWPK